MKLVVTGNQAITWYDSEEDSTEVHLCVLPTPLVANVHVADVTDLMQLFANMKDTVKKVLYEGHIYIMTNGHIFNAEGVKIE